MTGYRHQQAANDEYECIFVLIFLQVMNVESDTIVLRRMEFFHRYDIEVWLRKEVSGFLLTSSVLLCKYYVLHYLMLVMYSRMSAR